jgi:hypothetical protein
MLPLIFSDYFLDYFFGHSPQARYCPRRGSWPPVIILTDNLTEINASDAPPGTPFLRTKTDLLRCGLSQEVSISRTRGMTFSP